MAEAARVEGHRATRVEDQEPGAARRGRSGGGRRRLVVAGAAVGVGALTAAAVVFGGTAGGGGAAHASWTPVPQAASAEQALEQARACAASWEDQPAGGVGAEDVVLAERRGAAAMTVVRKGEDHANCLSVDPAVPTGYSLVTGAVPGGAPQGRVHLLDSGASQASEDPEQWISQALGTTGPGVTGVDVVAADGSRVAATVSQGFWAAWWPGQDAGEADGFRVEVHTAEGTSAHRPSDLVPAGPAQP